ncbi:hypothetical protein B0H17DRAFT_1073943 [Mycena rosella]|uniref:Uncharacterized protein n=1 Tax=Mycena rosella TaxID=1033263 RepID=A0AAD7D819_MYCRO|nr:hypothetical protein B0H17DRAFT_1073943 [Mycena rosella]
MLLSLLRYAAKKARHAIYPSTAIRVHRRCTTKSPIMTRFLPAKRSRSTLNLVLTQ